MNIFKYLFFVLLVILAIGGYKYVTLKNHYAALQGDFMAVRSGMAYETTVEKPKTITKTVVKYVDVSAERLAELSRQYNMKIEDLNSIIKTLRSETTVITENGGKTTVSEPVLPEMRKDTKNLIIAPGINKNGRFAGFVGYKWVGVSADVDGSVAGHLVMRF